MPGYGDCYLSWGWTKAPALGDIYKKPTDLLRLFRFRENLVKETVFLLNNPLSTRGIVLSGLPGVGKTTFLNYLKEKYFKERMQIVSLAGRLGAVKPSGLVNITNEQFLHIFSEIEKFLLEIIKKHNLISSNKTLIKPKLMPKENRLPFKEFSRDILLPLCEIIGRKENIPQYFLVIDDVDYVYPTDQTEILAILCDIIATTANPIILYSARPAAAGVAKNHLLTYTSHHFGEPIDIDPINAFSVVKTRLQECVNSIEQSCGPFLFDKSTEDIFISLSNNNIRTALDLCHAAIMATSYALEKCSDKYDKNSLVKAFFGRAAVSKQDEKDADNDRHIQNIFRAVNVTDAVPFDYITLLSFRDPAIVNAEYTGYFNDLCRKINPTVFQHKEKRLKDKDIISYVLSAYDHAFITRIDKVIPPNISKDDNGIWLNRYCLTPKGQFMLEITKDPLYQELSCLDSWRHLICDNIRDQNINVNTIDRFIPR